MDTIDTDKVVDGEVDRTSPRLVRDEDVDEEVGVGGGCRREGGRAGERGGGRKRAVWVRNSEGFGFRVWGQVWVWG